MLALIAALMGTGAAGHNVAQRDAMAARRRKVTSGQWVTGFWSPFYGEWMWHSRWYRPGE